ncbi:MAG: MerR family transcriptional regulator [Lachnospiraceae bacterium]|nr:MerR family transcriptional regulator [Lachnospiraceae bacterium]
MKINQVEELVGITKKNIRFYEDKGLINPNRNSENGYRDYNMDDVLMLNRIKLLRRLDLPIEEIKKLESGETSISLSLEKHIAEYDKRKKELDVMKEMCNEMIASGDDFDDLNADFYLEDMNKLEKGGVRFLDVKKNDVKESKVAPIIASIVFIALFVVMIGLCWWSMRVEDDAPFVIVAVIILIFVAMIVGVLLALKQRLKEIEKGELNEAGKY